MNQHLVGTSGERRARTLETSDHILEGQAALLDIVRVLASRLPALRLALRQAQISLEV